VNRRVAAFAAIGRLAVNVADEPASSEPAETAAVVLATTLPVASIAAIERATLFAGTFPELRSVPLTATAFSVGRWSKSTTSSFASPPASASVPSPAPDSGSAPSSVWVTSASPIFSRAFALPFWARAASTGVSAAAGTSGA